MGYSNGVITAPVSIADVESALGGGSYDVATLCMQDNINKWSLRKPVSVDKKEELTDSDFKSANHGLTPPVITNANPGHVQNLIDVIKNKSGVVDWEYKKPGASDWKRLTDFSGYRHNMPAWFNLQTGIDPPEYAAITQGQSITIEQDAGMDISWLQNNMSTFSTANMPPNKACSGVMLFPENLLTTNRNASSYTNQILFCAFRTLGNLHGRSNFTVGIPSSFPIGKYAAVPCVATFDTTPPMLVTLTDSTTGYQYVFFSMNGGSGSGTPPVYAMSMIKNIYPLPCTPAKIQVYTLGESPSNPSLNITARFNTAAGQYGVTTTSGTYNGKDVWTVKLWGNIIVSVRAGASSSTSLTATITLKVPNWVRNTGYSGTALSADSNGRPYKTMNIAYNSSATWSIPSSNPLTFHLEKDNFDANAYGWYSYDSNNNPTFQFAYLPYIQAATTGVAVEGTMSILD